MHEQEQEETVVYAHMHGPFEKILSKHLELQKHIQNKNLHQGEEFWTEESQGDSLDGCKKPRRGRNISGFSPQGISKPVGNFVNQAQSEDGQRYV